MTNKTPDYFLDWAFEEVQRLMHGKPNHILVARTTVDLGLQKAAENALEDTVNKFGRSRNFNNGALVSMETDGAVRAMVGGKDYGSSQFNRAAHAYRQPGSSFKPYVYLTALEHGYTPDSYGERRLCQLRPLVAEELLRRLQRAHVAADGAGEVDQHSRREAVSQRSIARTVLANMEKMGIKHLKKTCSMALGDNGMTPLEHVGGYAVFAAGGLEVRPYAIEEIRTIPGDCFTTTIATSRRASRSSTPRPSRNSTLCCRRS